MTLNLPVTPKMQTRTRPRGVDMRVQIAQRISDMVNRAKLAALTGLSLFGGKRDLYAVFGYEKRLTPNHFLAKYLRQDLAKRIIDAPVLACWSRPPKLESDNQAFVDAWEALVEDGRLFSGVMRLDRCAGLGRYAVLVIGCDDGRQLHQPIRRTPRTRRLTYLQPYLEEHVDVDEWDLDPTSEFYGQPLIYKIRPGLDPSKTDKMLSSRDKPGVRGEIRVHRDRVLHVAENILESPVAGASRLECIYNLLDDLAKTVGGSAETFWLTGNRGMQIDIDKDMVLDEDDAEDLSDEVDEYEHGLRRTIRTRGTKITPLGSEVADPRGIFNVLIALISAATGIPQRILIGAEAGQLASAQDRANWADRIEERRAEYAEPIVLRPLIRRLIHMGILPEVERYRVKWPDAFKLNPLERSQTSAQRARSLANAANAVTKQGEGLMPVAEIREHVLEQRPEGGGKLFGPKELSDLKIKEAKARPAQPAFGDSTGGNTPPTPPRRGRTT
jgi:hypothetical protein